MRELVVLALLSACAAPTKKPTPVPQPIAQEPAPPEHPDLWPEEVSGDEALAWVREQNKQSTGELLAHPAWKPLGLEPAAR